MKAVIKASIIAILAAVLVSVAVFLMQDGSARIVQEQVQGLDPNVAVTIGSIAFALGMLFWGLRVSAANQNVTRDWSKSLARMEADLEKTDSILASHPGLVLVWAESEDELTEGWGSPRVLGGPAALASLITFASKDPDAFRRPAESLLDAFGDLQLTEDAAGTRTATLREKVNLLRSEGLSFSGTLRTEEGRSIECDGRVAGDQVTLWLTDPAVRLAEETGVVGQARDRASDLHGAFNHLDRAPLAAWRRSPDLKLEWVNRAYVEMVEAINMEEVIAEQREIDPGCVKVAEKAKTEHARSGRKASDDLIRVNIRGQRRVLRIIEQPMHASGDRVSMAGLAIDVTRQDKAQEELRRHQEAHRQTIDQLGTAVAVFSANQQLEYYNQSFVELWGLEEAELLHKPSHAEILDRLRHLDKLPAQSDFGKWKREQLEIYTEDDGQKPDETWHLPSGRTLRIAAGRHALGGVAVVFEDITQTVELQTLYQTQIKVQRATLNNLAEGVVVFGADGRLALYNQAFEEMWDLSDDQLQDAPHFDRLQTEFMTFAPRAEEDFKAMKRRIVSFSPQDRQTHAGGPFKLKDGRWMGYATSPLPDGATLVSFIDVTDSQERQRELEVRNQILEDADRIKTRFTNHISYQLRDPLNVIKGFAEVLENEFAGPLSDRQKDYTAAIVASSLKLLDLVDDIIDLAAVDAGQLNLEMEWVDVRELMENAKTYAALKAEDSQIKLIVDCDSAIGQIRGDGRRLKQVIFNLLSNAFQFTEPGGEVTLGAEREGEMIRLWVSDTGRGVTAADQAKVFERYEAAGPGAGAGVGLALVNSFVSLHGGFVKLSSREDEGTTVTCHLPMEGLTTPALAAE
ncbi:PAS domain-containing protein [Parvularcula sp. ZS-1/3]|uniref:histidine kinase n=1 Tax=Parvularcula mediterranea TaxID=2732508 RepID=A0A7Y3RLV3_9PROT|nr:PAS domain-containing sensor histidine kinase [Parvularcula mediterranea]NNU16483.1 PAS domain-containing protein [Parvularcula mediterranea]